MNQCGVIVDILNVPGIISGVFSKRLPERLFSESGSKLTLLVLRDTWNWVIGVRLILSLLSVPDKDNNSMCRHLRLLLIRPEWHRCVV
jgi:hypothetical protein